MMKHSEDKVFNKRIRKTTELQPISQENAKRITKPEKSERIDISVMENYGTDC